MIEQPQMSSTSMEERGGRGVVRSIERGRVIGAVAVATTRSWYAQSNRALAIFLDLTLTLTRSVTGDECGGTCKIVV